MRWLSVLVHAQATYVRKISARSYTKSLLAVKYLSRNVVGILKSTRTPIAVYNDNE